MKTENTVTWSTITWYWELFIDKNENIVQTRGMHTSEWGKKGYETSVIGRQEREKSTKYDILHIWVRIKVDKYIFFTF